jgi:hypothetical protein
MRIHFPNAREAQSLADETGMGLLQARYHLMGVARLQDQLKRKRQAAARGRF